MTSDDFFPLPDNLPVPPKTQEAIHLAGHPLPPLIELPSTAGGYVDLFLLSLRRPVLLFVYPRTAAPGEQVAESWNAIPGARGCSPHLCGVRDQFSSLVRKEKDLAIFGLSSQTTAYQSEAVERLRLPFPLLSDAAGELRKALDLPTFSWHGQTYLQRATLLLRDGQITQVQHPVFPPTTAAAEALKMLDAGKPAATAAAAAENSGNMMSEPYEGTDSSVVDLQAVSSRSNVIRPRDLTGSIRSFKALQRLETHSSSTQTPLTADWRNSLVAVDNETGEVVGILAHNVHLSGSTTSHLDPDIPEECQVCENDSDDEDEDVDEAHTPPSDGNDTIKSVDRFIHTGNKKNTLNASVHVAGPVQVYYDPDVRPRSREGSVLGEDTFAPPPVPDKAQSRLIVPANAQDKHVSEDDLDVFSDGEAVDGFVRTNAKHVEAHQPGLLRDRKTIADDVGVDSDASGSTIGGPVVQIWRKARGGRKGEKRRKAKKEAAKRQSTRMITSNVKSNSPAAEAVPTREKEWMPQPEAAPPVHQPPSAETVNISKANRARRAYVATSAVQSIEDRVWQSALESGSLPIDAPYTHLHNALFGGVRSARTKCSGLESGASRRDAANEVLCSGVMQGNSVLLEFLAGSRIAASVIYGAASNLKDSVVNNVKSATANDPSAPEAPLTSGIMQYVPVIPDHLLWFFGSGTQEDAKAKDAASSLTTAAAAARPTSFVQQLSLTAGTQLVNLTAAAPAYLLRAASSGASVAWNSFSAWGWDASAWLGSTVREYVNGTSTVKKLCDDADDDDLLKNAQPGDEDAREWHWTVPYFDKGSLSRTPRPVYRRKRPIPSLYQGFQVRERQEASMQDDGEVSVTTTDVAAQRAADLQRRSSRYSIVHFDSEGYGRHAFLNVK